MRRSLAALEEAGLSNTPWLLEFPEDLGKHRGITPASIWQLPELRKIAADCNAKRVAIHQYNFGAAFPKPTGILATIDLDSDFGVEGWPVISETGQYKGPLTRIAAPPMKLGPSNTAPTAEYPEKLARSLARMAINTLIKRGLHIPTPSGGGAAGSMNVLPSGLPRLRLHHPSTAASSETVGRKAAEVAMDEMAAWFSGGEEQTGESTATGIHTGSGVAPATGGEHCAGVASAPGMRTGSGVAPASGVHIECRVHTGSGVAPALGRHSGSSVEDLDGEPLDDADLKAMGTPLAEYQSHRKLQHGLSSDLVQLKGQDVADACGLVVEPAVSRDLIGAFNHEGCIDVWNVGPDEPTSEEDVDGFVKPKRGHGRYGRGQPILASHNGKLRPLVDGCGLCCPGRWAPHDRHVDAIAVLIRGVLWSLLCEEFGDPIRLVFELVLGRHACSPFSCTLLDEARRRVRAAVGGEGKEELLTSVSDQPFFLHLLAEVARVLGDPDWRVLAHSSESYAKGVPVGFKKRLPRTPAVYDRKRRWRKYDAQDFVLELKHNYKSTAGREKTIEQQYQEEAALGMMVKMRLSEAKAEFKERLRIAPMGALTKSDDSVRPLHDGTHGPAVNPNLRVRDQLQSPASSDVRKVFTLLYGMRGRTIGLKADVSKAHRRYLHRRRDWGLMACVLEDPEYVWLNKVGTFGMGCASYWWGRLFSVVCRCAIALALRDPVFQLLFADDLNWLASGRAGMESMVAMILYGFDGDAVHMA